MTVGRKSLLHHSAANVELGPVFRQILRLSYDNLNTFGRCTPILTQVYDNTNFSKFLKLSYEQSYHSEHDKIH